MVEDEKMEMDSDEDTEPTEEPKPGKKRKMLLIIIGAVLCITVILLPVGVTMIAFGFLLTLRGLF